MIQIPLNYLKALLVTAGKDDVRQALNGVYVEVNDGVTRLVTTDGARLLAIRLNCAICCQFSSNIAFVMPRELVENVLKVKTKLPDCAITTRNVMVPFTNENGVAGERERIEVTIAVGDQNFAMFEIDAKFPDFRRAIPQTVTGEAGCYDNTYTFDFDKIVTILTGLKAPCAIGQNGENAALVNVGIENAIGVLMPMRARYAVPATLPEGII